MNIEHKNEIVKRFWERVFVTDNGCWKWKSYKHSFGYGVITSRNKYFEFAHRISWEIHFGAIPDKMCVLHKCDDPECTNPEHLFLGTKADNNMDKVRKGRLGCPNGSRKLSKTDIQYIKENYVPFKVPLKVFADKFNVSEPNIHYWLHHK